MTMEAERGRKKGMVGDDDDDAERCPGRVVIPVEIDIPLIFDPTD
jgi:hypothetical protein